MNIGDSWSIRSGTRTVVSIGEGWVDYVDFVVPRLTY